MGDVDELLQTMDAFCFKNQHFDCLYTLFKNRFSRKIVAERGQVLDIVQGAVHFSTTFSNRRVGKTPSIEKKDSSKKYLKKISSSLQKNKWTQKNAPISAARVERVEKTKLNWNYWKTGLFSWQLW